MRTSERADVERALQDLLEKSPPSALLVEMIEHYRRAGFFRPEDLRRLFGDPSKGITVGPNASVEAFVTISQLPSQ